MINRLKNSKAGFTLIELMVTMCIVGILAAIAIPSYASYREKGYATACKSDGRNAYNALVAWTVDNSGVNPTETITDSSIGVVYSSVRASKDVTIVFSAGTVGPPVVLGNITVTHANLAGAYSITGEGVVTNTLG